MRARILLILLLNVPFLHAQKWIGELRKALPETDELTEAVIYKPKKTPFLFYSDSCLLFEKVVQSHFAKAKTWKKHTIKSSSLLNEMCRQVTSKLNMKAVSNPAKHHRYLKRFNKLLKTSNKKFSYIEFASFEVQVVGISMTRFYDAENGDSPYHLYSGKKPGKKELESGKYKYIGCKLFNEDLIADKIIKKLKTSRINVYLSGKDILCYGVSCVPKKNTFYGNGVPTISVFVMIGVSRVDEKKLSSSRYRSKLRKERKKTEAQLKRLSLLLNQKKELTKNPGSECRGCTLKPFLH